MSYLLYCILNGRREAARPSVKGVREQTVWILQCGGLCAAVSEAPVPVGPVPLGDEARLNDLIAYAQAIEAFNRRETVVPMRYGCRFADGAELRQWMHGCAPRLRMLMLRIDGCVEMGVRAIPLDICPPATAAPSTTVAASGAAYLAARRNQLLRSSRCDDIAQGIQQALSGQFRQCITQVQFSQRAPMVSLYFLVERNRAEPFRSAFSGLAGKAVGGLAVKDAALMLSGPWPPYNFVCSLERNEMAAVPGSEL